MTETLPGFERPPTPKLAVRQPEGHVVRVQPDITSIGRSFDYEVPSSWELDGRSARVDIGSLVRVDFNGRRTAGWVTAVDVVPDPTVELQPLVKWSSHGPPADVLALAEWSAWRWAGRLAHFLRAASPPRMVTVLPRPQSTASVAQQQEVPQTAAFRPGVTVVRTTPADHGVGLATAAAHLGSALILVPTIAQRIALVRQLRTAGVAVAEYDEQWGRAAAGGATTVGTRTAAFAPMPVVDAVLVLDEHESTFKEERTPAWNARDVAIERARLAGVPCVLASPTPSLEALSASSRVLVPERSAERTAWPMVDVIDMREQDQPGLLTEGIVDAIRGEGPVACILNRKGRARMLACARCSSLAVCSDCGAALREDDDGRLTCPRDGTTRPMVCSECNGTHMKHLRLGISRLAEDLSVLAKRDVMEVSAETPYQQLRGDQLFIGTAALLHRLEHARSVIFLDFDQELAVPRVRAAEDAFAMLGLAARRVGPRADGGRLIVQTRRPDDVVVQAAQHGDPSRVAAAQRAVRQVFRQPPYGAWAVVSGPGADAFVAAIDDVSGSAAVRRNRLGDRWRLSADTHDALLDVVHAAVRPAVRVRIEIDPIDL
jgi:primosomal protein N' (replication factor Y)